MDASNDFAHWQYENGPTTKSSKRRFFTNGERWDETVEHVLQRREDVNPVPRTFKVGNATGVGRIGEPENMEEDWMSET